MPHHALGSGVMTSTRGMPARAKLAIAFAPFVAICAVHLVAIALDMPDVPSATKPLLMPGLLLALLIAWPRRAPIVLLLAALEVLFAWAGDVLLADPGEGGFLLGLGAFFLAHVAGLALYLGPLRRRRPPRAAALLVLWWVGFLVILWPHVGSLLVPVAVYGLVLGAAAAAACGTNRWIAVGALAFLASDSILACRMFIPDFEIWQQSTIIMTLYLAGQGLIVYGVLQHVRKSADRNEVGELELSASAP